MMSDEKLTPTRRSALKTLTTGIGVAAIPSIAAAGKKLKSSSEFINKLNSIKRDHGRIKDVKVKQIREKKPKKVKKTLVFSDGHEEMIFFIQKSDNPHSPKWKQSNVAKWKNSTYRLNLEPPSDFDPKPPVLDQEAIQASLGTTQASPEWRNVTIGKDELFTSATHGRATTQRDWIGTAKADYDGTECQFATKSSFLGIPGAYTQTWVSFVVNSVSGEPDDRFASFDISSSWDASWVGVGGSGAWKVGVYVYDYEAETFVDKEVVDHAGVNPADFRVDRGSDVTTLGVNLEAGKHYGVGMYAGGKAGAVGLASATVDLWPGGDFDGGARWSLIDMNWG